MPTNDELTRPGDGQLRDTRPSQVRAAWVEGQRAIVNPTPAELLDAWRWCKQNGVRLTVVERVRPSALQQEPPGSNVGVFCIYRPADAELGPEYDHLAPRMRPGMTRRERLNAAAEWLRWFRRRTGGEVYRRCTPEGRLKDRRRMMELFKAMNS